MSDHEQLKDVTCEKCKRVIGQRDGSLFIQFGMRTKFNKTARIFCPFIGCGFEQDFSVNREKKSIFPKFSLTNAPT